MKNFFALALLVFLGVLLLGCVKTPEEATPTPSAEFEGLKNFVQTPAELDSLKQTEGLNEEDSILIQSNEAFLTYKDGVQKLNNIPFDCLNSDLYQQNLDQLQVSINKGKTALPLTADSKKKDYWTGFFQGMQTQKDSYQQDLDGICPT